jgi:hypothetical protein
MQYTNKSGIVFDIESSSANVPSGADYFAYSIRMTCKSDGIVKYFKAIVSKELCQSNVSANIWLSSKGYDFLKEILDTYNNGDTLILIPETLKWIII